MPNINKYAKTLIKSKNIEEVSRIQLKRREILSLK